MCQVIAADIFGKTKAVEDIAAALSGDAEYLGCHLFFGPQIQQVEFLHYLNN